MVTFTHYGGEEGAFGKIHWLRGGGGIASADRSAKFKNCSCFLFCSGLSWTFAYTHWTVFSLSTICLQVMGDVGPYFIAKAALGMTQVFMLAWAWRSCHFSIQCPHCVNSKCTWAPVCVGLEVRYTAGTLRSLGSGKRFWQTKTWWVCFVHGLRTVPDVIADDPRFCSSSKPLLDGCHRKQSLCSNRQPPKCFRL